jgi:TPR repeat protein
MAAEQGYAPAQNALGLMYLSGRGVIKDHIEAYKWYVLAAMQSDEFAQFAQELKEHLDQTMALDQIEEGQRRAREFLVEIENSTGEDRKSPETTTD